MHTILFEYLIFFIKFLYVSCGFILFLYGINIFILSLIFLKNKKNIWKQPGLTPIAQLPIVTIQLPIYNEGKLVTPLLRAISSIHYPRNKLQIQVLDDSNDSTSKILIDLVDQYKKRGFWIDYHHRKERTGFKAGNLASGLVHTKGDFIVIFDADFKPNPEFIEQTLPYFNNEKVGFIQTRWLNRNLHTNLVTYMAGLAYDAHLIVEQNARNSGGLIVGFSGSGGIWRKTCLQDIGGWQWDTLTEDIDITFRSQLGGWKGVYIPQPLSTAELPENMDAYILQQNRWAKGSAQCFRKYIKTVLAGKLPFRVKVMATLHLLSYVTIPFMPLLFLLVLPISIYGGGFISLFWWLGLGGIGPALTFFLGQLEQKEQLFKRLLHLPLVILMAAGISLDAFEGVLSGFLNQGDDFIRTPRVFEGGQIAEKESKRILLTNLTILEILMGIYLIGTVYLLWYTIGKYLAPWLLSSAAGFFLMSGMSIIQYFCNQRKKILRQEN
jgi:cellulose synthase/poly-beta-1,6-N-acetylglucosamine synthase-like glycosyltransferase